MFSIKNAQFILHYPSAIDFSKSDWKLFYDIKLLLEKINIFHDPKIYLEQYSLPSDLISYILILTKKDLSNKNVVDLGCGTGRFSLPISKFFSDRVLGVDNDFSVLENLLWNMNKLQLRVDLLQSSIEFVESSNWRNMFQTTIMNPPFGTQRRGIDQVFLRKSLIYSEVVLSIHKSSKRSRKLWKQIASSFNKKAELLTTVEFSLPRTFSFHTRNQHKVKVDLFRFFKN